MTLNSFLHHAMEQEIDIWQDNSSKLKVDRARLTNSGALMVECYSKEFSLSGLAKELFSKGLVTP